MSWNLEFIVFIVISTLVDYFVALRMDKIKSKKRKKRYLYLSLFFNLSILILFKYYNFVSDSIRDIFGQFSIIGNSNTFKLLLPIGISFYTLQTISYTIDVYRGKIEAEKHFGKFALYVSFFPQLIAGPIERASNLLPQFSVKHKINYKIITTGLKLMFWGFFKKIVIADNLAGYVNIVYKNPEHFKGFVIITATFFFAFQVYCDFSGYTDIARGAAKIMGINLLINFKNPFFSTTIREFWQKWHISLMDWFRDYLYIPLGGSRVSKTKWYYNIFIVFLISGLWHGANWGFILFGMINGIYVIFGHMTNNLKTKILIFFKLNRYNKLYNFINIIIVFILFSFSLIFFKSESISTICKMFSNIYILDFIHPHIGFYGRIYVITNVLLIGFVIIEHFIEQKHDIIEFVSSKQLITRWSIYIIMSILMLALGNFGLKEFIYFQF